MTAALTFVSTVTGISPSRIDWAPANVDEYAVRVAVEAAENAIRDPLVITQSKY